MADEAQPGTVKVECSIPNGLVLQIFRPAKDEFGISRMVRVGDPVALLGSGITEVNADFWKEWSEQNDKTALISGGFVRLLVEQPK